MKRISVVLLSFIALSVLFNRVNNVDRVESAVQSPLFAPDRILVKYRPGIEAGADRLFPARSVQADVIATLNGGRLYEIRLPSGTTVEQAIAQALLDPNVEYAEPDYFVYPEDTMPDDPRFGEMWGLFNTTTAGVDIGAIQAWDFTTGSRDVIVAVIDTGMDLSHPDLNQNLWVNSAEIPGNGFDDDNNGLSDDVNGWNFFGGAQNKSPAEDPSLGSVFGHGTHVAGTIGAVGNNSEGVAGVSWEVRLMPLRIFGPTPGEISDAIAAINYAIQQKNRGQNIRAINASWSTPGNAASLREAIVAAGQAGIVFVCAAGNGGSDFVGDNMDVSSAVFPAAWSDLNHVISVAALNRLDDLDPRSNFGHNTVTVGAPGVVILSTAPGGTYAFRTGTSMASPHVAGIAALLAAQNPSLSPAAIKQRIIATGQPILALASKVVSSARANAFNALTNTISPAGSPAIRAVQATKKFLTIDGLGFVQGAIAIEVNGVPIPRPTRYDSGFVLANGSFTEIFAKLGKPLMNELIPAGVPVTITVVNMATSERSAPVTFVR